MTTEPKDLTQFETELLSLRQSIDAIDEEMIALIKKRCEFVKQVGKLKEKHVQPECFIRPAREAMMVKSITAKFSKDGFHPAAAAAIWRSIIAASTNLEKPLKIIAHAPSDAQENYWLAREYFGSFSQISKEPTLSRLFGQLMDGKAQLGIVPPLSADAEQPWWQHLVQNSARPLAIFASLPVCLSQKDAVAGRYEPLALAVGAVTPEPTGDDISYAVLDVAHDVSQSRITSLLAADGHKVHWLSTSPHPHADRRCHLVQVETFLESDSALVQSVTDGLGESLHHFYCLGAHARPLVI